MDKITKKKKVFGVVLTILVTGHIALGVRLQPLDADGYWAWAKKKDTAQAYRCFVYHYPKDPRAVEAKERWAELDFVKAQEENTHGAYRRFLSLHPNSRFAIIANDKSLKLHNYYLLESQKKKIPDSPLSKRAMDILINALKNSEINVRERAIRALGQVGESRAVDSLLAALEKNETYNVINIGEALYAIGDPHVNEALVTLSKDSDHRTRWAASRALAQIGDPRAADAFLEILRNPDAGWLKQEEAAVSLARIGDPRALDVLLAALKANTFTREHNVRALGIIGDPLAVDALIVFLKDSYSVQKEVVIALGYIEDPCAIPALIAALKSRRNIDPGEAAEAFGRIGHPSAVDTLITILQNRNYADWIHSSAASALGEIGDPRAIEPLIAALGKSSLCLDAAKALCQLGDTRATQAVVTALDNPSRWNAQGVIAAAEFLESYGLAPTEVRTKAAEVLGTFRVRNRLDDFVVAIQNYASQPRKRFEALETLGSIGDLHAMIAIQAKIKQDAAHRGRLGYREYERCILALSKIALRTSCRPLIIALSDPNELVRQSAAEALAIVSEKRWELLLGTKRTLERPEKKSGDTSDARRGGDILAQIKLAGSRVSMGDMESLSRLSEGLSSSSIDVQFAAVSALGAIGEQVPSVTKDLKKALAESKSETVKLKITGELAKNKDPEALKEIRKYVKSEDPVERIYAAEVLGQVQEQGVADELVAALDDEDVLVRVHAATAILRILQIQATASQKSSGEKSASVSIPAQQDIKITDSKSVRRRM